MILREKKIAGQVLGLIVGVGIGLLLLDLFVLSDAGGGLEFIERPFVDGVDASYAGKYQDHPEVKRLLALAGDLRRAALQRVVRRTGLAVIDADAIVLSFRDASDEFVHKAVSRRVSSPDGVLQLCEIGLERFVTGCLDIERTLTHEFSHAVMRQAMKDRYGELPRWFREGAAVWTAEQLDAKVRLEVARRIMRGKDPASALDGLAGERIDGTNYLDEGFVFALLERRHGMAGVQRVLERVVVAGEDHNAALESVTGVPVAEFITRSQRHGAAYLETILRDSGSDTFAAAVARRKADDDAAGIRHLRSLLQRHPDSFLVQPALFLLATLVYDAHAPEATLAGLDALIAEGTDYPWLATKAAYIRARRLLMAGHYGRAVQAFEQFIRDYAWNGPARMADARCNLAAAWIGAGRPGRAVELIRPSLRHLQPAQAENTRAMLRDALRMLDGDGAAARADAGDGASWRDFEARAAYARMGTYADYERLAAQCRANADCVVVTLPGCRPGPSGRIDRQARAAVNREVKSRYLAMLRDRARAACAGVVCPPRAAPGQPVRTGPEATSSPEAPLRAVCAQGRCVLTGRTAERSAEPTCSRHRPSASPTSTTFPH